MGKLLTSGVLSRCFGCFTPTVKSTSSAAIAKGIGVSSTIEHDSCSSEGYVRHKQVVQSAWGDPVKFTPAMVNMKRLVSADLWMLHVDVGAKRAAAYTKPGQYVQVKVCDNDAAAFFAISSSPQASSDGVLELLIKVQLGSTSEAVCMLGEGEQVLVSPVQGNGFQVEAIPEASNIVLVATGSGISPIRAVIESGILRRTKVQLLYGTRDKASSAFLDLIPKWEAAGVQVTHVYSSESQQYVQYVLQQEVVAGRLLAPGGAKDVGVLLCGHKGMCEDVKGILSAAGVEPEQILTNF